jgi:predicted nucleic acid-binding protein
MNSTICVDASILIKLIVDEPGSDQVDALWQSWIDDDVRIMAPSLLRYEITAVLRKKVHRKQLSEELAAAALSAALDLSIVEYVDNPTLHPRALGIACQYDLPTAYDAHYLALAQIWGCAFWTADRRLHRQVKEKLPYVQCLPAEQA